MKLCISSVLAFAVCTLAATTCQQGGTPDDNFCILTTEGWNPAAASYIVDIDYNSDVLLFDPFQHIRSSLGTAEPSVRGPAFYSLALGSLAVYVPEDERGPWESVLQEALSLQTAVVTADQSPATSAGDTTATAGQPVTSAGQPSSTSAVVSTTSTPSATPVTSTPTVDAQQASTNAGVAGALGPTAAPLAVVLGAIAGAAGVIHGL